MAQMTAGVAGGHILAPLQPGSAALTAAEVSLRSLARRHDGHYAGWA